MASSQAPARAILKRGCTPEVERRGVSAAEDGALRVVGDDGDREEVECARVCAPLERAAAGVIHGGVGGEIGRDGVGAA